MADVAPSQRIVPGAPPPPPLSKNQKKKRKSMVKPKTNDAASSEPTTVISDTKTAALVEKAPGEEEVKKGVVAEELVAPLEPIQEAPEVVQEKPKKTSAAVELLNKRIKVQNKKLSRIQVYSSKPASELNEDQKKSVASLPSIQGAVRELEETRKAIETLEAEEAKEREKEHAEQEKATKGRISQAVSDATETYQQRLSEILSLLRLSALLSASDPTTFSLAINDLERQALYIVAETLLGSEGPRKEEVAGNILLGQGEIEGVTYSRLLEVIDVHRNPPLEREPTPTPTDPIPEHVEPAEEQVPVAEPPSTIADVVVPATSSGSFHFMQESELEGASFEHGVEWVEKPLEPEIQTAVPEAVGPERVTVIDTGIPLGVNGVSHPEEPPLSAVSAALDWAAEDGDGLPSIDSLHAKFGTSGAATPEAAVQDGVPVGGATTPVLAAGETNVVTDDGASVPTGPLVEPQATTASNNSQVDEDGFVKARGRKSDSRPDFRGRGRGGFRGDRSGEHRGGFRGGRSGGEFGAGWNGNPEFRGRGGFRGGDRGRSGEFRGGAGRGGGGRGGEFRGRGRGDRGGHRGGRGGPESSGEQASQS